MLQTDRKEHTTQINNTCSVHDAVRGCDLITHLQHQIHLDDHKRQDPTTRHSLMWKKLRMEERRSVAMEIDRRVTNENPLDGRVEKEATTTTTAAKMKTERVGPFGLRLLGLRCLR